MTDQLRKVGDKLETAIGQAVASDEQRVTQIGDVLEEAVRITIQRRDRRARLRHRAGAGLVATGCALAILLVFHPWHSTGMALAASSRVTIYRAVTPQSGKVCYTVKLVGAQNRVECASGGEARFATHVARIAGRVSLYGRAAVPRAVRVILDFPGHGSYTIGLQHSGYWAWDAPERLIKTKPRAFFTRAVSRNGLVVAVSSQVFRG